MVFFYAPMEAVMGDVQRSSISTWPTAGSGMLGFVVAAVAGRDLPAHRRHKWDMVDVRGRDRPGLHPDQHRHRLDLGAPDLEHLVDLGSAPDHRHHHGADLRRLPDAAPGIEDPDRRARFGAVYAIIGFISVPLTFFSIRIFRTIHPVVIGGNDPALELSI